MYVQVCGTEYRLKAVRLHTGIVMYGSVGIVWPKGSPIQSKKPEWRRMPFYGKFRKYGQRPWRRRESQKTTTTATNTTNTNNLRNERGITGVVEASGRKFVEIRTSTGGYYRRAFWNLNYHHPQDDNNNNAVLILAESSSSIANVPYVMPSTWNHRYHSDARILFARLSHKSNITTQKQTTNNTRISIPLIIVGITMLILTTMVNIKQAQRDATKQAQQPNKLLIRLEFRQEVETTKSIKKPFWWIKE